MSFQPRNLEQQPARLYAKPVRSELVYGQRIDAFGRQVRKIDAQASLLEIKVNGEIGDELEFLLRDTRGRVVQPDATGRTGSLKTYCLPANSAYWLEVTNLAGAPDWFTAHIVAE